MKVFGRIFFAAATLTAASMASAAPLMQEFSANGLELSGAEYWPYHGTTSINYPDDVLWGFYPTIGEPADEPSPASATPAAIACAETAFQKLQTFIAAENAGFHRVVTLGASHLISNKFFLWTNDYSDAATPYPDGVRAARLWYWTRNPQVPGRTPGYWKWESVLTQDGQCLIPDDAQIADYVAAKLAELEGH